MDVVTTKPKEVCPHGCGHDKTHGGLSIWMWSRQNPKRSVHMDAVLTKPVHVDVIITKPMEVCPCGCDQNKTNGGFMTKAVL